MNNKITTGLIAIITIAFIISLSGCIGENTTESPSESASLEKLNVSTVTTKWDLSFLFDNREEAITEFNNSKLGIEQINNTYRTEFENLNGKILLEYIEDDTNLAKSIGNLWIYAHSKNTLNVNDEFFETLVEDIQDLDTQYSTTTSFATVKLKSISKTEWDVLFNEEPGLEKYRPYLESTYIRFVEHRPQNESHAAFLENISNQRMKLETDAMKLITNNVTAAGNITLDNGEEYVIDSQSYYFLVSTDINRNNRKKAYDKRYYHLINESDRMAQLYSEKVKLDDRYAQELDFTDSYEYRLFKLYLTKQQTDDMNSVFKERKDVFEKYIEFRKNKLGLDQLQPYDMSLQLMDEPDKQYNYTDSLLEIQNSYSGMDPVFNEIFIKTVTGNYIDVYPDPENGKQPGGYAASICALKSPSIIFLNYDGLINDKKTITHELGHGINFYLMANNVDYLYCGGNEYEWEIPSTFNEELFVDYIIENYDTDTAVAVLSDHIGQYENYFGFQPLISEFEYEAHKLIETQDGISGAELNSLWTNLDKEYRSESIEYYEEDSAGWTYIPHIYYTNNYYTFNYAVSKAITLSLFKQYKEDPAEFNRNYIEYLSAGTTLTPPEKLKKYFDIEINKKLFEDAMDVVELRIDELNELNRME